MYPDTLQGRITNALIIAYIVVMCAVVLIVPFRVWADPGSHSQDHQTAHSRYHRYYSGIMRPDVKGSSCCSGQDCSPTDARWNPQTRRWSANKYGRWVDIPPEKIVPADQVPDELGAEAHLCAPPPSWTSYGTDEVFCLILPNGGT